MNFNYPLGAIFRSDITKITHDLLQNDEAFSAASHVIIRILDEMGIASAKAQDLQQPITSWNKLRNSDDTVYLLVGREGHHAGDNGLALGFLKVGKKNLYLFDLDGKCHERATLCVLDFYIHESVQRTGLGKKLFEYMLEDEHVTPDKLALDRPSHKILLFLQKHYGLADVVSQSNNFAVFTGFFDKAMDHDFMTKIPTNTENNSLHTSSLSTSDYNTGSNRNDYQNSGRHTAYKREDTMGQIIH